jgi:hypothetical protein
MLLSLTVTYAVRHQHCRSQYKSNCLNCPSIFPLYVNSWHVTVGCQKTHNISCVEKLVASLLFACWATNKCFAWSWLLYYSLISFLISFSPLFRSFSSVSSFFSIPLSVSLYCVIVLVICYATVDYLFIFQLLDVSVCFGRLSSFFFNFFKLYS